MANLNNVERNVERSTTRVVRKKLLNFHARTIFDVGANIGQSAIEFSNDYPEARIYSFEPIAKTFNMAQENCKNLSNVSLHNIGLGRSSGESLMTNAPGSVANRVVSEKESKNTEIVRIATGDDFCEENNIGSIDYLKIDTEGLDLQVLVGFIKMLSQQRIELVEVEVGMNPGNQKHVPFENIKNFLEPLEYYLFHVFDMVHDIQFSGRPLLRRSNMIFISETAIAHNNMKAVMK